MKRNGKADRREGRIRNAKEMLRRRNSRLVERLVESVEEREIKKGEIKEMLK
jgi:hypothetical protein